MSCWRKLFSQLCVVYVFSDIRQTEKHTVEPLVLDPRAVEFGMSTEMVKTHRSVGMD
jgi:hypothetical protein